MDFFVVLSVEVEDLARNGEMGEGERVFKQGRLENAWMLMGWGMG